ncbi:hypothetical protein LEMLEM_LOCUS3890 [Lemmus lemmus]
MLNLGTEELEMDSVRDRAMLRMDTRDAPALPRVNHHS